MYLKKISHSTLALTAAGILSCLLALPGCGAVRPETSTTLPDNSTSQSEDSIVSPDLPETEKSPSRIPRYVFLFIGDGMSYPQFQLASSYLGAISDSTDDGRLDGPVPLNFMQFESIGTVTTYDSSSFCPDSASTATAIASGHKTSSGTLNMDETATEKFRTIAEQIRDETGKRIGIVTSANLNHATPAAFYAHQNNRSNSYEIGKELLESGFDYFAGGLPDYPSGKNNDQPDFYGLAAEKGYQVCTTEDMQTASGNAENADPDSTPQKLILLPAHPSADDALDYEIDRKEDDWALSDYVEKGIEELDNEDGFFLMCEGGKIDWACHANDAATAIHDVLALSDAVQTAMDFAEQHPSDTLILVTGDHETGGLTIGYAETRYKTHLEKLQAQKISFRKFDTDYVQEYMNNALPFEETLTDLRELFGLEPSGKDTEILSEAYDLTRTGYPKDEEGNYDLTEEQYLMYGGYTAFSMAVTHLMAEKAGIHFSTYSHTGLPEAVFASGAGAEAFEGSYDNTGIHDRLVQVLALN